MLVKIKDKSSYTSTMINIDTFNEILRPEFYYNMYLKLFMICKS